MEVRDATADDFEAMRRTAAASMHESYDSFLDPETIDAALDEWYGADTLAAQVTAEGALLYVAVEDDDVVGFVQAETVSKDPVEGRVLWLHVHPDARGDGVGSRLFVRAQEALVDAGAERITGVVLEGNDLGTAFYEGHGFTRAGEREVEVGDESYAEAIYVQGESGGTEWESLDEYDVDGRSVYVSYSEADRGSNGPLYTAYSDPDREQKYGFFCGACHSFDVSMDSMGVVECNDCENRRKATRWDASYL
ncbi:GNAT family N-acetyltransferase [Halorubellus litoreus]|uniref:GNAT family N-acetyltransferase n=1 Tax=Halorubellus litoreus TaxID=755308 RepID=A0ABD5VMA3_9EURY